MSGAAGRLIFVDGMNVIGARADGWWRDRTGAMGRLLRDLEGLAAVSARSERWTLVLDGRPRDLSGSGAVGVEWAPGPGRNAADARIVELVAALSEPRLALVYTSDRALREDLVGLGATVEGASSLLRRLEAGR